MAFLEWRKFTFFDVHDNADNKKIAECLQDTNITAATSGNGQMILCDVTGWAHLVSRTWEVTSFKAYELTVMLAHQLPHDPYLVTIGEDEPGINPLVKVWDWSRSDRHGNPTMVRVTRAVPANMRPTALAVHDSKSMLAVGFQDGSITLFRDDITRQRGGSMKVLPNTGNSPITSLAFNGKERIFAASRANIMVIELKSERCVSLAPLDSGGCAAADPQRLTLANNMAIYCYTASEGRGPCYALEGEKVRLNWFRNYLVVTSIDASKPTSSTGPRAHRLTILDIQNKFIVFAKTFEEIDAVLMEWGAFFIVTKSKEVFLLEEKDLQSKLMLLFKKNLYDVAIRIASSQHYDAEGLAETYKQYGDHLYTKGDLKSAIEQYVKTIGYLESSYVIRKYLEGRQLEPLVQYLEELHRKGLATEDHTTLLLTCILKVDQHSQRGKLRQFIASDDRLVHFDVDVAIKVVRQVSVDDALSLAAAHGRHDAYLKMMLDDKKDFSGALTYLSDLPFEDAEAGMKQHGQRLMQYEPEECTELLKLLCTDYKPRNAPLVDEDALSGAPRRPLRASPEDFIHMFLTSSERLIQFLEHMLKVDGESCSKLLYDSLVEHYIHVWLKAPEDKKQQYEARILEILRSPDSNYDKDQTLIICQMLGFKAGVIYLYEENKLWRELVSYHMRLGDAESALGVCRNRSHLCPGLWLDVLWWRPPAPYLPELLSAIANEKLQSPILVIDCLAGTPTYTLGDVRKYLTDVLKAEQEVISQEQALATKYRSETAAMKAHIVSVREEPVTFQNSRCAACTRPLELPTVHFFCQHSYHQPCFMGYAESECECPKCMRSAPRRASHAPHTAEALHSRLRQDHDPYAVVSEYFGRGLFNKLTLVTSSVSQELPVTSPPAPAALPAPSPGYTPAPLYTPAPAPLTYGPGAEAKLRLQEGQSKQVYVPAAAKQVAAKGSAVVPMPEGRMRLLEQDRYSSSLEANMNRLEPVPARPEPRNSPVISTAIEASSNTASNPFEDPYDETKNPFADEDPKNPFNSDDDYDANLNPFS